MPAVTYDIEATGFKYERGARMFSYATCDENERVNICRLDGHRRKAWHKPQATPQEEARSRAYLHQLVEDRSVELTMHNAQYDLDLTERALPQRLKPIFRKKPFHDTMAQSHILQNHYPGHSLANLGWDLAEYTKEHDEMVKLYTRGGRMNFQQIPRVEFDKYQAADVERGMILHMFLHPKVMRGEWGEIYQMERDLAWVTIDLQRRGVMIDEKRCHAMIRHLEHEKEKLVQEFHVQTGQRLSPGNDNHIRVVLFDHMKLPVLKLTPKEQLPAVDKDVLMMIRDNTESPRLLKLMDTILKFRSYRRGVSIVEGYIEEADDDGTLRSSISRFLAKSSRQTSRNPNLQNVNKSSVHKILFPVACRSLFRPRPGFINLHVDYQGIEMRLLVDESGEQTLIDVLLAGKDIHEPAAVIFFQDRFRKALRRRRRNKKWAKLYKTLRDAAKNCNFAVPYGAGFRKIAKMLLLPEHIGEERFKIYQRTLPDLCGLSRRVSRQVREAGYITTRFGRRLHLPRDKAYAGTNYLIQGTAAGILKRAQVRVDAILKRETGGEARILLPIHDEIVIEYPRKRLRDLKPLLRKIRKAMLDFPQFRVPMEIDVEYCTRDWDHLKELEFMDLN